MPGHTYFSIKNFALDHHPVLQLLFHPTLLSALQAQGTTVLVMILFLLLFLSFVLSGAEVAFFSLTYKDINNLKAKQQPPFKRIVDLLEEPKTLLASLLIANSFINISTSLKRDWPIAQVGLIVWKSWIMQ